MIKVAHIVSSYQSVVRILDVKLDMLSKFENIDVTAISSPQDTSNPEDINKSQKPAIRHIPVFMHRKIRPLTDLKSIFQLYQIWKF
jgi:hypothetical protein